MNKFSFCALVCVAALSQPVAAQTDVPDLLGEWECGRTDAVFRQGDWAVVEPSVIEITEQRGKLFAGLNR